MEEWRAVKAIDFYGTRMMLTTKQMREWEPWQDPAEPAIKVRGEVLQKLFSALGRKYPGEHWSDKDKGEHITWLDLPFDVPVYGYLPLADTIWAKLEQPHLIHVRTVETDDKGNAYHDEFTFSGEFVVYWAEPVPLPESNAPAQLAGR